MNKAVVYMDILGFSNAVMSSVEEAILTLSSFNTILHSGIIEKRLHPSTNADPRIRDLAKRTSIECFEEFIPFSDSVFATSQSCDDFIMQLGHFALGSFKFTSHIYRDTKSPDDPTLTYSLGLGIENGQPCVVKTPIHQPPVLFRAGLAYGDVQKLKPLALVDGISKTIDTLAGEAVVRAAKLETIGIKGPRFVFKQDLYGQLSDDVKCYCRIAPEQCDLYEVLWPAMGFTTENASWQEFDNFTELFEPAYNLWYPFKHANNEKVAIHYCKFIELIIASTIKIYDKKWNAKNEAINKISNILKDKDLMYDFSYLLN